jgi:hypothetical protein
MLATGAGVLAFARASAEMANCPDAENPASPKNDKSDETKSQKAIDKT